MSQVSCVAQQMQYLGGTTAAAGDIDDLQSSLTIVWRTRGVSRVLRTLNTQSRRWFSELMTNLADRAANTQMPVHQLTGK